MLLIAVALAVAAVPEGLPAIVTIALAIGVERMAMRRVLVGRLAAVETLGAVTVICTDKTGTLTTGVMALRETWGPDRERLLRAAAGCCDAELDASGRRGVGDPTELAILAAAAEQNIERGDIETANPRVAVRPFDPATRSMSVTRADGVTVVKGAVETVLEQGAHADISDATRAAAGMASRGLRVLAVAETRRDDEGGLQALGLLGLADPPLADDNFASIVAGVREGRGVQANIRKAIVYLLAGNVGELTVMAAAAAFALPLPLLPLHLLWINLVTDGLPALALVMDPASPALMKEKPRDPSRPLIGRTEWGRILVVGALTATVTPAVFAWALGTRSLVEARDLAFSTLVLSELFRAFAARDPHLTYWQTKPLRNLRLVGVVVASAMLQVAVHQFEFSRRILGLGQLSLRDHALVFPCGAIPASIVEIGKLARWAWRR